MRMPVSLGMLLVLSLPVMAQDENNPPIRLTVKPVGESSPALRWRLLPELRSTSPGNAAVNYYRAFSPEWLSHLRPEVAKRMDEWFTNPDKVPLQEFAWVKDYRALQEIDRGARREFCDWGMTERVRESGIMLLLPDIQAFRAFIRVLDLRIRLELVDRKHDKVQYSLQTGLQLSRHVGDAPTLIQSLVGMALAQIMLEDVERWIQTPGAPNLYWPLTDLPRPFMDIRKPLQGERIMAEAFLGNMREVVAAARTRVLSQGEVDSSVNNLVSLMRDSGFRFEELGSRASLALLATRNYPEGRQLLLREGRSLKEVDEMPLLQVALLYELNIYEQHMDDITKWCSLPYWQARPKLDELDRKMREGVQANPTTAGVLTRLLLPAVHKIKEAENRLDRRIAALRVVEAIRLHAASHQGALPQGLEEITAVPIPLDPATGQSFGYRREGDRAIVIGPAPVGKNANRSNSVQYEITLQK